MSKQRPANEAGQVTMGMVGVILGIGLLMAISLLVFFSEKQRSNKTTALKTQTTSALSPDEKTRRNNGVAEVDAHEGLIVVRLARGDRVRLMPSARYLDDLCPVDVEGITSVSASKTDSGQTTHLIVMCR